MFNSKNTGNTPMTLYLDTDKRSFELSIEIILILMKLNISNILLVFHKIRQNKS